MTLSNMKIDALLTFVVAIGYGVLLLIFPVLFNVILIMFLLLPLLFIKKKGQFLQFLIFFMPILIGGFYSNSIMGDSMFGIGILGVLNIIIPFLIFFTLFFRRPQGKSVSLNTPIIIFLTILGFSVFYSPSFIRSAREWFRIAMPIVLYYLVLSIGSRINNKREFLFKIIKLLILSSIIPLGVGFFQLFSGDLRFVVNGLKRIYGTLGHPNTFSAFLIVCFTLLFFMFVHENKLIKKFFYLFCIFITFFSLIFTFARMGWLAFFVCFTVVGVMKYRKYYIFFLTTFILICACIPTISNALLSRLKPDASFYLRFSLNQFSWDIFTNSPLIGHGLASFPILSKEHFGVVSTMYGQEVGLPQHNDYLKFLTESGIFGLMAYLLLIFSCLKLSFRMTKQKDALVSSFGSCLVGIILATFVLGLSDQGLKIMGIYPWILLGLGELLEHSSVHENNVKSMNVPIKNDIEKYPIYSL